MSDVGVALWIAAISVVAVLLCVAYFVARERVTQAKRYAVTLVNGEGAFVALCIEKRSSTWTFVDVKITPRNPAEPVVSAAPGRLYVPKRNILYYQEITNVAE